MPVSRELTITYGSFTVGGSGARQITGFSIIERSFERAAIEFSFVTTATTEAAFATEVDAIEDAFRTPRLALTVTQGSATLLTLSQALNTGFDADPRIVKRGDPGDTGRSRHYTVRIEFGQPADVTSTSYRRGSTISIDYSPSRRRTVTISGTYTAKDVVPLVAARAQYLAQIASYATTVLSSIDSTSNLWEKVAEPQVETFETDKVCNFTVIYKENLFNQAIGTLDNTSIIDPVMTITREKEAPGDSVSQAMSIGGGAGGALVGGGGSTVVGSSPPGSGGGAGGFNFILRPKILNVTYQCGVDSEVTVNLRSLWTDTIRPFIIASVGDINDGGATILLEEKPNFEAYNNTFSATMKFVAYATTIFEQRIHVEDTTSYGRVLVPVTSADVTEFYDYPGPVIRIRKVKEERKQLVKTTDAHATVETMVKFPTASVSGINGSNNWVVVSRTPTSVNIVQGLPGVDTVTIAEITIETILQYRKRRRASTNPGSTTTAGLPS